MNKWIWALVVIIIVGLGWWAIGFSGNSADSGTGPIKIGFIAPLTGDASSIGTVVRSATEIAVNEINAAGGINGRPFQVDYQDGQCNAQAATNAANKLIGDKVTAILGGLCSTETAAFGPTAMQNKVIVISFTSSAPNLSQLGKYFFRDYPSDSSQGKFAADYAYDRLGVRKVAVMYHISDWGTGIKDVFEAEFKARGGTVVADEGALQTATDYRTSLLKIKSSGAEYVYSPTYPAGATAMLKQAKEIGVTKFLGGDAWSDTQLQSDVGNLGLTITYVQGKTEKTPAFVAKLSQAGQKVTLGTQQAYDAVYVLADALKKAGTSPDKLADVIRATDYDGVSGHIRFDDHGDLVNPTYEVYRFAGEGAQLIQ